MKSFSAEVAKICSVELASLLGGVNYTVYDNRVATIEGVVRLASYRPSEVVLVVSRKQRLTISGEGLVIKCYQGGLMVVEGVIISVGCQHES